MTLWTVARQAPLSIARILEWVAMPSSRGSSDPEVAHKSLTSLALVGQFFVTSATWEAQEKEYLPQITAEKLK